MEWGIDLATEHERYLTEKVFKKPVIVYDYPKGIKAFYMRANDDGRTVAAMGVLVPKVGELSPTLLIGGFPEGGAPGGALAYTILLK